MYIHFAYSRGLDRPEPITKTAFTRVMGTLWVWYRETFTPQCYLLALRSITNVWSMACVSALSSAECVCPFFYIYSICFCCCHIHSQPTSVNMLVKNANYIVAAAHECNCRATHFGATLQKGHHTHTHSHPHIIRGSLADDLLSVKLCGNSFVAALE